jgi:biopolymer transport protein ExbD
MIAFLESRLPAIGAVLGLAFLLVAGGIVFQILTEEPVDPRCEAGFAITMDADSVIRHSGRALSEAQLSALLEARAEAGLRSACLIVDEAVLYGEVVRIFAHFVDHEIQTDILAAEPDQLGG